MYVRILDKPTSRIYSNYSKGWDPFVLTLGLSNSVETLDDLQAYTCISVDPPTDGGHMFTCAFLSYMPLFLNTF